MIPSNGEAYDETSIWDAEETDRQKMLTDLYKDIECMEECFHEALNEAENDTAEIIGKMWSKFTDLCALLVREMYALPKDEEEE